MSSLLEQAIADAKMLKETARKNAEAQILEERAEEIKRKIEMLFEEEDPLAGLGGDVAAPAPMPSAAPTTELKPEVKKTMDSIPPSYLGEGEQEIEINLESLVQKVSQLEEEVGVVPQQTFKMLNGAETHTESTQEDIGEELNEVEEKDGDVEREKAAMTRAEAAKLSEKAAKQDADGARKDVQARTKKQEPAVQTKTVSEDLTLDEAALEEDEVVEEELVMDMQNVEEGGINNFIKVKRQKDVETALAAQGKLEQENAELSEALVEKANEAAELEEQLDAAIAKLQETKDKLKKSVNLNVQLKEGVELLTRKINDVNLLNARLLYTNKTLGNSSLNERQKRQIAESVSKAKTVDEAKMIYETLQRSVQDVGEKRNAPQSLTEALSKSPAPFLPRKEKTTVDPVAARWQLIAGIKK